MTADKIIHGQDDVFVHTDRIIGLFNTALDNQLVLSYWLSV